MAGLGAVVQVAFPIGVVRSARWDVVQATHEINNVFVQMVATTKGPKGLTGRLVIVKEAPAVARL
jgi:hypothetical protein